MINYDEQAFEAYIESALQPGWTTVANAAFDPDNALFPEAVLSFIQRSQPELWKELEEVNGDLLGDQIIKTLVKERLSKGTLYILRHGFKFQGKVLRLAYYRPAHSLSREAEAL